MVRTERLQYSENRKRADKAASYNTKYDRQLHKRLSKWREKRLIAGILRPLGKQARVLDVPAGTGRLSDVISGCGNQIFQVDYSREMLHFCRRNARGYRPMIAQASAFRLPFPDGAFDLVISIRLSHHIPEREGRRDHVRELCRASRRYVLMTFFGEETLKNRLRRLHARLGARKRAKYTLGRQEVKEVAAEAGFRVLKFHLLSRLFSGHFFALLERA